MLVASLKECEEAVEEYPPYEGSVEETKREA